MKLKSIVLLVFMMFGAFLINSNAQSGYGYSYIEATQPNPNGSINIYAESGTVLDYQFNYDYQPGIQPTLFENGYIRDTASLTIAPIGYNAISLYTNVSANYNATYRLHAEHYVRAKYYFNTPQGPSFRDYWGLNGYQGNYPTPYSFAIRPTAFYSYHTYRAASTEVEINVTRPLHLSSIDRTSGVPSEESVFTAIRGTGLFGPNRSLQVSGSGVTATLGNTNPNQIELQEITINIEPNAARGERQLTLRVNGVTSNPLTFTIGDNSPQITNMTPPQANTGETVSVTISGSHFGFNPLIQIAGTGIQPTITSSSPTSITALFTVLDATTAGERGVKVKSRGYTGNGFIQTPQTSDLSNSVPFNVLDEPFVVLIRTGDGVVEKYGELNVFFDADLNSSQTIKFTIRRISGTGEATFTDGSIEKSYTGFVGVRETIKGITESSQASNFTIEARVNNSSTVRAHNEFTVAKIDSLVFEQFNTGDIQIDNNPGTDGIHTPEEGYRIYPDKISTTDTIDRATIRVKATVSPAIPGLTVYFASFDLDDPSAIGLPIDTTTTDGKDNNGDVNGSKSGEFTNPTGGDCLSPVTGTSANDYVSKINCTTSTTTVSSNYKVTMQPGDNFAVAASLSGEYRDFMRVNSTSGNDIIDYAFRVIHINGQPNATINPSIRTDMLTVWRKLHIEVDSMGAIIGNNVTGTITVIGQTTCPTPPNGCVNNTGYTVTTTSGNPLEDNRFAGGRIVIGGSSFSVIGNSTANIILNGQPRGASTIRLNSQFTLYDDDDMNDDGILDGDQGDDVAQPDTGLLSNSDDPSLNVFASAYIKPVYDLGGIDNSVNPVINISVSSPNPQTSDITSLFNNFNRFDKHQAIDFWSVYLLGGYQYATDRDGDPKTYFSNGTISTIYGAADVPPRSNTGQGAIIFTEDGRTNEYPTGTVASSASTAAHEVGHLFRCDHADGGLMSPTAVRTSNSITPICLDWIRKTPNP